MDACPRVTGRLFTILQGKPQGSEINYKLFLLIQVAGCTIMLLFLMGNFTTFLYFAASMGFIASPAIAYYNYRAITSDGIADEYRPTKGMLIWSWAGIFFLTAFAVAFLYTSLG